MYDFFIAIGYGFVYSFFYFAAIVVVLSWIVALGLAIIVTLSIPDNLDEDQRANLRIALFALWGYSLGVPSLVFGFQSAGVL